jgi:hypothetical protein
MIQKSGVKATCKNCGKPSAVEDFVLDPNFKMMVCLSCSKGRRERAEMMKEVQKKREDNLAAQKEAVKDKPRGWDQEDEYLERMNKSKNKNVVDVTSIDDQRVKYKCPGGKYGFAYDQVRKHPPRCPFCGMDIQKMRLTSQVREV